MLGALTGLVGCGDGPTERPATGPILAATELVTFSSKENADPAAAVRVGLSTEGEQALGTLTPSIAYEAGSDWLTAQIEQSPSVSVAISPATTVLAPGTYAAIVTITSSRGFSPAELSVQYTVTPRDKRLTIVGAGTGHGDVTIEPGGQVCSYDGAQMTGTCDVLLAHGAAVSLRYPPDESIGFAGWSAGCRPIGIGDPRDPQLCRLTMDEDRAMVLTLNVPPPPGGDVVVLNDLNIFDETAIRNLNNLELIYNLVEFSGPGTRSVGNVVRIDCGHGSLAGPDCGQAPGFFPAIAEAVGYTVEIASSAPGALGSVPNGVKTLVLVLPCAAYTIQEVSALKTFAAEGGRIIYMGEAANSYQACFAVQNQLLHDLGVAISNIGRTLDDYILIFAGFAYPVLQGSMAFRAPHQVTLGVESLTLAQSSGLALGPGAFPLFFSGQDPTVPLAAVASVAVPPP
jgi:hypothetical protein